MSTEPNAPIPAGQDPDDAPTAAFAPPVDAVEPAVPAGADPVADEAGSAELDSELTRPAPSVSLQGADAWEPGSTPGGNDAWGAQAPGGGQPESPPDPVVATPSAFTPPGTPEPAGVSQQAAAMAERPEVQVGLAFLGGAVVSFVLKRFGR